MIPEWFVYLAALINFFANIDYVIATLRGKVQPNRVTWFIWGLLSLVIGAAQLADGVGLTTLMVFTTALTPFLVFIASFMNQAAYWKIGRLDYSCGALSLLGLVAWGMTKTPDYAIAFSILADIFAAIPTLRKAYISPQSENGRTYLLDVFSIVLALLCIKQQTFAAYAFLVYLGLFCLILSVLVYRKKLLSGLKRVRQQI